MVATRKDSIRLITFVRHVYHVVELDIFALDLSLFWSLLSCSPKLVDMNFFVLAYSILYFFNNESHRSLAEPFELYTSMLFTLEVRVLPPVQCNNQFTIIFYFLYRWCSLFQKEI